MERGGLSLTRKLNESIFIGDDIEVEVVEIRGNRVQLKTYAPKDIRISRSAPDEQREAREAAR